MNTAQAIGSGVAGAVVLTALHESIKQIAPNAPRMDHIGMQIVKKAKDTAGKDNNDKSTLYDQALAGDLVANSLLYSIVGAGERNSWLRGLIVGAGAGIAAVVLPQLLPVDEDASSRNISTAAMTIGVYALAGLAAAGMKELFRNAKYS
ncbi:MAG: hypothetical protein M3421_02070 [Bacteroidota bacterium]|jgi:hypothetical protein|nr:hypothetical protein [Bacteroidota bacterium]